MQSEEEKFPEPPELRKRGIPPLKKELKFILIAFAVAFIIVLIFSIIFKTKNG
jgi:cell division protein FtsL